MFSDRIRDRKGESMWCVLAFIYVFQLSFMHFGFNFFFWRYIYALWFPLKYLGFIYAFWISLVHFGFHLCIRAFIYAFWLQLLRFGLYFFVCYTFMQFWFTFMQFWFPFMHFGYNLSVLHPCIYAFWDFHLCILTSIYAFLAFFMHFGFYLCICFIFDGYELGYFQTMLRQKKIQEYMD